MMKKVFNLFLILSFSLAWSQNDRKTKLEITFQDFFEKDNVSLRIDGKSIFKNYILTSRMDIGLADLDIIVLDSNDLIISNKGEEFVKRKINLKNRIKLSLMLNGVKENLVIYLKNGKFIGLSKDRPKQKFHLYQSKHAFEYD